jgi:hypothetical protein
VVIDWMKCPEPKCRRVIVKVELQNHAQAESWFAVPRYSSVRSIDPEVPDEYALPFKRACRILNDAPEMAAVLARRVLADLLNKEGGYKGGIKAQIDAFIDDPSQPDSVKKNLHYLREIGNFGAHTQEDRDTGEPLDPTPEEAEWTLDVVESLFDTLVVAPRRDAHRRTAMDEKLRRAGREPIAPLDDVVK